MKKIILTKGLPASGKTSWAKEQVARNRFKRINKDDLRDMIDSGIFTKSNENMIIEARNSLAKLFLSNGYSIIIDDTNLHPKHEEYFSALAKEFDAKFSIKSFLDIPLDVCIDRDKKRPNYVGENTIKKMHREYISQTSNKINSNPNLPPCIIVDIDGTIADYANKREWMDYENVYLDEVKHHTLSVIESYCTGKDLKIFFFSGRENTGKCFSETTRWLVDNVFANYPNISRCQELLELRAEKDYRKDSIVKKEMYEKHIKNKYNCLLVFDDRNQVVDMWRNELQLFCLQVSDGDF